MKMYILPSILIQTLLALVLMAGLSNAHSAIDSRIEQREVRCDLISKYSVNFFKRDTCNPPKHGDTCVFYTYGLSKEARRFTRKTHQYVSIWTFMQRKYYNNRTMDASNPLRCIMRNKRHRQLYFKHMSEAYAYYCNLLAFLMSNYPNDKVPLDGIWGETEFPTLRRANNNGKVDRIDKINTQGTREDVYWYRFPNKTLEGHSEYTSEAPIEEQGGCGAPDDAAAIFDKGGALPVYW